jgi:hypothetical protein
VAQVAFERHILKPGFHVIGARVETRRLSATGSYGSGGVNVHRPPHRDVPAAVFVEVRKRARDVVRVVQLGDGQRGVAALQVEFERQTLKPVFHLIGFRLWV